MIPTRPIDFPKSRPAFALGVFKEHLPRHLRRAILASVLRVSRLLSQGNEVECPVCGAAAIRFFRDRCLSCSAASRQRLLALFLRHELDVENTADVRILHFAPEPGLIRMLSEIPNVDYVPADLIPDKGHERVDATAIHLEPTFDGIITSHVLEHIPDDLEAIAEMFRVLQPGGWAIVMVPVADTLPMTYENDSIETRWARHLHFGQHDHVRVYGKDLPARLTDAGFTVQERRYADEFPPKDARRFGLNPRDIIFFCRKRVSI